MYNNSEVKKLYGTGVALVTPFTQDLEVDYNGLANLLKHTSEGVDYLVVQGTTGESPTVTSKEKKELLRFVQENNPKSLPIVYGIGGNSTQQVVETIQSTDLSGVSALLSVSPYYNKPSQKGIIAHYEPLAEASPVPIILYNVPGRTGSNMIAETTLALAAHENIIGVKEASGDLVQGMQIAKHKPEDFLLISGDDLLTVPLMSVGAKGVISVLANAFPKVFKNLVHYALEGSFVKAQDEAKKVLEVNPLMYEESNPVGVKHVLKVLGIMDNYVRLPLVPASASLQKRIEKCLERM